VAEQGSQTVYLHVNPVAPDLVLEGRGVRKADIVSRRWFGLDVDPAKPEEHTSDSATESEKEKARGLTDALFAYLDGLGWPRPVVVDSGNGFYLLYRIDLPHTDHTQALLKGCLHALAGLVPGEGAVIDRAVHDGPRLFKLPGSWAMKGEDTVERPWRRCRLLHVPEVVEVVTVEQLQALLSPAEPDPVPCHITEPPPNGTGKGGLAHVPVGGSARAAYARKALEGEVTRVLLASVGNRNNTLNRAAFALGQLVSAGLLSEGEVISTLSSAATARGLGEKETECTIRSGLDGGKEKPRELPADLNLDRNGHVDYGRVPVPSTPPLPDLVVESEPWPAPLAQSAFYGLAGCVVGRINPETEADPVAVLIQFLTFFGNAAGRNAYRSVGSKRHYPNLFCVLVGRTAKGRKGTSLDWIDNLFRLADPDWSEGCVTTGLSTGEGLINAVRDRRTKKGEKADELVDEGVTDKRLLVIEEEFAQVLRLGGRDGNILSTVLRQSWDGGRLRTLTRQNPLKATDAHVSVVGHVTRDELLRCLASTDQSNGFCNRFLWCAVRRSKLLPDGGDQVPLQDLADWVSAVLDRARSVKRLERTEAARDLWHQTYPALTAERPGAFGLCTNRAEAQVLRLSVVYALLDGVGAIDVDHLLAALALWDYCERSCRWIFGDFVGDADADEILLALRSAGKDGLTTNDIRRVFSGHRTTIEIRKALTRLLDSGLVECRSEPTKGRPVQCWFHSETCAISAISAISPGEACASEISNEC
jgi:hypothetical protein